jgi:hypothetical protein
MTFLASPGIISTQSLTFPRYLNKRLLICSALTHFGHSSQDYSFTVSGSLGILGIQLELRLSKMLSLERHIGHKADRWKQVLRYVTKSRCLEGSALVAQPYSESRYCSTSVAKVYRIDYKICPPGVR